MHRSKILSTLFITLGMLLAWSGNVMAEEKSADMGTVYMVTLHTDKFNEMKEFYSGKLGFDVINKNGNFVEFRSKGIRLSLIERKSLNDFIPADSLTSERKGSAVGIGFKYKSTQEVDEAYSKLKSKGVAFVASPKQQEWGEYTAFFSDPDGNIHELVYY